jgi:hypothetical protein
LLYNEAKAAMLLLPAIPRSRIHLCYLANKYFSHLPSNSEGVVSPPNGMRTTPTTIFQPTFLLHTCETHLSYRYWGRYIGCCCSNSPNIHKNIIGLPQYMYIRDRLLRNWWRCS